MDVGNLKGGDEHYLAYVGPPEQYDFMGATQFRLLCSLGLRANHSVLDFGCGSLRAGRFIINYLERDKYYGVDPNRWLVEDGIKNNVGKDMCEIKKPSFDYNESFSVNFDVKFDFIVAQSIFSHTGIDLVERALNNFHKALAQDGRVVLTFVNGSKDFEGNGWIYPGCVLFKHSTVLKFAKDAGFFATRIPWYHPRQSWYILTKDRRLLPTKYMKSFLKGAVLFAPEFETSWKRTKKAIKATRKYVKKSLLPSIKSKLGR